MLHDRTSRQHAARDANVKWIEPACVSYRLHLASLTVCQWAIIYSHAFSSVGRRRVGHSAGEPTAWRTRPGSIPSTISMDVGETRGEAGIVASDDRWGSSSAGAWPGVRRLLRHVLMLLVLLVLLVLRPPRDDDVETMDACGVGGNPTRQRVPTLTTGMPSRVPRATGSSMPAERTAFTIPSEVTATAS